MFPKSLCSISPGYDFSDDKGWRFRLSRCLLLAFRSCRHVRYVLTRSSRCSVKPGKQFDEIPVIFGLSHFDLPYGNCKSIEYLLQQKFR